MGVWSTRLAAEPATERFSPGLLFHKWHEYDLKDAEPRDRDQRPHRTDEKARSRPAFLRSVADAAERARSALYSAWHTRFLEALHAAGISEATTLQATTLWRLVVGFATNPALETGISLHPLYGFPYLPASAVKGLVHQVAERALVEGRDDWARIHSSRENPPVDGASPEISDFLQAAESVREIFGSLNLEPALDPRGEIVEPTARSVIARWRARDGLPEALRRRFANLLDVPTGGAAVFYDAVPAPDAGNLLELDLLNPHYPEYYAERAVPSDDQNPNPVYFLALRAGVSLEFRFRLRATTSAGSPEQADRTIAKIRGWLREGLEVWGAGGKTAAGYGYFEVKAETEGKTGPPPQRPSAPPTVPRPNRQFRVQGLGWGNAESIVQGLLKDFSGDELRAAALQVIERLTPRDVRRHSHLEWVKDLLAAANS